MDNLKTNNPSSSRTDPTIWSHAEALYAAWFTDLVPWFKRSKMFREDLYDVAAVRLEGSSS